MEQLQIELKDFIKGIVSDIAIAIEELNEEHKNIGLLVNPANCHWVSKGISETKNGIPVIDVEFNLSISASDKTAAGGGLKISVVNAGVNNETNNTTISTIKFSIPIAFPGCADRKMD